MDVDLYLLGPFPEYGSTPQEKEAWYKEFGELRLGPDPYPDIDGAIFRAMSAMREPFGDRKPSSYAEIGTKLSVPTKRCEEVWEKCLQRAREPGYPDLDPIRLPSRIYDVVLRRTPYDVLTEEEVDRLIAKATEDRDQRVKGWKTIANECGLEDIPAHEIYEAFKSEGFRRATIKPDASKVVKQRHRKS